MNPAVKQRTAVWAGWITCVLAAALTVAAVVIDFQSGHSQSVSLRIADWSFTAVALPFAIVGALIVVHRPGNRLGGLLLVGALPSASRRSPKSWSSTGLVILAPSRRLPGSAG
jgi:hypothetical protein